MKKIMIIVASTWLISFVLGKIFDERYRLFWHPVFDKFDIVFKDSAKRDIVFEGDSRANQDINPYYIDSVTDLNSFNSGIGGASVDEVYFLTESWLYKHAAPKLFVVSISYPGIAQSRKFIENPCYYFFYTDHPVVRRLLSDIHYHPILSLFSPLIKYTAFDEFNKTTIFRSFRGERFLKPHGVSFKGFFNNDNPFLETPYIYIDTPDVTKAAFKSGLKKFDDLLNMIHKTGSKCLLIYPPSWDYIRQHSNPLCNYVDSSVSALANHYSNKVIRYDNDSSFQHSFFQDPRHLNLKGAAFFSRRLAQDILKIIN